MEFTEGFEAPNAQSDEAVYYTGYECPECSEFIHYMDLQINLKQNAVHSNRAIATA